MDELTEDLIRPFDYTSTGIEHFYPYLIPDDLPKDFGIGVIVGASGTGKSTLLKSFGDPSILIWETKLLLMPQLGKLKKLVR
jgi:RecA-family ATPase